MRLGRLAALAAAAVLALSGCAGANPQSAAYVDGSPISQSQVDAIAGVLADSTETDDRPAGFAPTVLQILIQSKLVGRAAAEKGLSVPTTDRDAAIAGDATLSALSKNPVTTDFIRNYVDTSLLLQTEAGQAAALEVAERADIVVNPRFGTWDESQLALAQGSSGSLSEVAPLPQE